MSMWRFMGGMGCLTAALDCIGAALRGEDVGFIPAHLSWVLFFSAAVLAVTAVALWRGEPR